MIPVAVLGATGTVGQRFIQLLDGHPSFQVVAVAAGPGRVGTRYGDTTWRLHGEMPVAARDLVCQAPEDVQGVRVAFSALPGGIAGPIESTLAARGIVVCTNARDHRMDDDVPLLIPEVNPEALDAVAGKDGFILANGNCSGIILTLALAPLHRAFGIEHADVTTMQAISGAGHPGVPSMDILGNVVPFIGGEEDKLESEPLKTLDADFPIRATCTRVPVQDGHFESVHLRLGRAATHDEIISAFGDFSGPADIAALPSAPERPIHVATRHDRPQPLLDRDAERGMSVTVGRIRLDADGRGLRFVVLGHNTLRGAAGQSVLNAEFAVARGLI